jgi:putative nucleotidyltransferase with HDIG domain
MNSSLPDITRCVQLMEDFSMWENIRRHSFMVARVADQLLLQLQQAGNHLALPSRNLVIAGALLHDIAKTKCLQEHCSHAEVGANICQDLGFPEIAEIVGNHVVLSHFTQQQYAKGVFGATEIVFYADKRVRHDEVVSLDARLEYILAKYADNNPQKEAFILKNFSQCRKMEHHLFSYLSIEPDDILSLLSSSPSDLVHYPSESH